MKNLIFFIILFFFSKIAYAEQKTIECSIDSGQNVQTGEVFDTSTYQNNTWTIDSDKEIIISSEGNRWRTKFRPNTIEWGLCFDENDKVYCDKSAINVNDHLKMIYNGRVHFLNRKTLSYMICTNHNGFVCFEQFKGSCQIVGENKL